MPEAEDRIDRRGIAALQHRVRRVRVWPLVALAVGTGALAAAWLWRGDPVASAALGVAGLIAVGVGAWMMWGRPLSPLAAFAALVEDDPLPTYVTTRAGRLLSSNRAAGLRQMAREPTLAAQLSSLLAEPDRLVHRLMAEIERTGQAREEMVTRRGPLHVSAVRLGRDTIAWRVDTQEGRGGRAADALSLPMLTAGPGGTVLFLNDAFRKLLGGRPRHVETVFARLPVQPGVVQTVRGATGEVEGLVAQVDGPGGRREIYLLPPTSTAAPLPTGTWRIEDIPLPVLHLSAEGAIEGASTEARALLPMPIEAGMRLSDLLEGQGRAVADWVADVAEGRPSQGPQVLRGRGDHQDFCVRVTLSLAGRPGARQIVAVLSDVSELKKLEGQFVQSQKMQALGQLAGGVAHDFNNLLTAILGHCDLMMLRQKDDEADRADLLQVRENAQRAAALVGQLLAYSRKQSLVMEPLDLREAFADLLVLLSRLVGERVQVEFEHDADLHLVRADRRQLEQVVMNLVVNARDAMPEGGLVRVATANRALAVPLQRDRATVPTGRYVLIRVTDTGTGIPPERLTKIFEPFYTTKKAGEGTGLGLSTVYGIVKQTGGYIFVDSRLGEGTTFTIWLPSHGPTAAARLRPERGLATIGGEERRVAVGRAGGTGTGGAGWVASEAGLTGAGSVGVLPVPSAGEPADPGATGQGSVHGTGLQPRDPAPVPPAVAPAEGAWPAPVPNVDPAASSPVPESPNRSAAPAVLLVEDEAPVRAFASRALRLSGVEVIEADCAEAALAHLTDPAIRVDCVVSDVIMPGKDGPTWVREALRARPGLRVVFVSGYAEETFSEQRAGIPNAVFLPKPFSLADLTRTVRAQIAAADDPALAPVASPADRAASVEGEPGGSAAARSSSDDGGLSATVAPDAA